MRSRLELARAHLRNTKSMPVYAKAEPAEKTLDAALECMGRMIARIEALESIIAASDPRRAR